MSLFSAAADLVGNVGFGVIKNSGKIALGSGKAILGVLTKDEDLMGDGLGQLGKGTLGLGVSVLGKTLSGNDDADDCQMFDYLDE